MDLSSDLDEVRLPIPVFKDKSPAYMKSNQPQHLAQPPNEMPNPMPAMPQMMGTADFGAMRMAISHIQTARALEKYFADVAKYWENMLNQRTTRKRKMDFSAIMTKRQKLAKGRPEGDVLFPRNLNCDADWAVSKLYGLRDYTCVSVNTIPGYWFAVRVNFTNKFSQRPPRNLVEGFPSLARGHICGFIKLEETEITDQELIELGLGVLSIARNHRTAKTGRISQKVMKIVDRKVLSEPLLVTPEVYNFQYNQAVGGIYMDRIPNRTNPTVSLFDDANTLFKKAISVKSEVI